MPLDISGIRLSSPHSSRPNGSRIHVDKKPLKCCYKNGCRVRVEKSRLAVRSGIRDHGGLHAVPGLSWWAVSSSGAHHGDN